MFTMHALSLYDDTGRAIRQKTQGGGRVATTAITFPRKTRAVQLFESVSFE
jgi:hypothetical protein